LRLKKLSPVNLSKHTLIYSLFERFIEDTWKMEWKIRFVLPGRLGAW
jgi:hypothetical protein